MAQPGGLRRPLRGLEERKAEPKNRQTKPVRLKPTGLLETRRGSSIRAKVEHPFGVVKQQLGYAKVRYRGLAKNTARLTMLFALSNLWMVRRQMLGLQG